MGNSKLKRELKQERYMFKAVTLNGEPAIIHRDRKGWPHVSRKDGRETVPYSWAAVYNVCDNREGKF